MRLTTAHKIIASILLPVLVFLGGVTLRSQAFWEELSVREEGRIQQAHITIENALSTAVRDLSFIRQNPSLLIYAENSDEARRIEFEQFLVGLSNAKKVYQQLRFIDQNGWEKVRVDHNGVAMPIAPSLLQDKSARYYFKEAKDLGINEVYISKLDLNVENGVLEVPHKPMIRLVAPVFVNDERKGVIVINYLAQDFLSKMSNILSDGVEGYVLNKKGYWLLGPSRQLEWGFMLGKEHKFQDQYSDEWQLFIKGETSFSTRNGVFHTKFFAPDFARTINTENSFKGVYIVSKANGGILAGLELKAHGLEILAFAFVIIVISIAAHKVIMLQNDAVDQQAMVQEQLRGELTEADHKNTAIVEISHEGIITCAQDGTILDANPAARRMFRYDYNGLIGLNLYDQLIAKQDGGIHVPQVSLRRQQPVAMKVAAKRGDNSLFQAELTITETVKSRNKHQFITFVRDISRQMEYEEGLKKIALYDPLTGLPNRYNLNDCLSQLHKEARSKGKKFAIILLGLDEFHIVNDTLGHAMGDEVLKTVATRLLKLFPQTLQVARLAGDEFVLVLDVDNDEIIAHQACERILEDFSHSLLVNNHEIHVSMSLGLAFETRELAKPNDVLQHADSAMHKAKKESRNSYATYNKEMGLKNDRIHLLQNKLPYVLEKDELAVFFQPLVDAKTQEVVGAEALLRWQNAELGFISPVEFIPIAEKTGMIVPIGDWVIDQACQFATEMRTNHENFFVAINVSPIQFMACEMSDVLKGKLEKFQLRASALEIELTEGILVQDPEGARRSLEALVALGVSVSIDDFGTGYSSLSYLNSYPFKTLKIDRAFIMGLPDDPSSKGLSMAILSMARELNLHVIAEGTETIQQVDWLSKAGAHILQGYFFDKPMNSEEFKIKYLKPFPN
ncbi:MAG: EAL domain-containing protein [Methylocystaceae bacterium]|nr:EAL domain-containing protein [Methylocystaceae bacterium]